MVFSFSDVSSLLRWQFPVPLPFASVWYLCNKLARRFSAVVAVVAVPQQ